MEDEKKEEKGLGELLEEAADYAEEVVQLAIEKKAPVLASVAVGMNDAFMFAAQMAGGNEVSPYSAAKLGSVVASARAHEVVDRIICDVPDNEAEGCADK